MSAHGRTVPVGLCKALLGRWDPMFAGTVDSTREARVDAILAAVGRAGEENGRIVDLASGPGALTARLLNRYPECSVTALDADPVLLRVGQTALARYRNRTTWVLADLRERGWSGTLGSGRYDAVASSLALHWFYRSELRAIFRNIRTVLRPGGVFVNGDFLPSGLPSRGTAAHGRPHRRSRATRRTDRAIDDFKRQWKEWWAMVAEEPSFRSEVSERSRRMPGRLPPRRVTGPKTPATLEWHRRALRDAGFHQISVVWNERSFRVVRAIR
jgi:SAM-dependent methyltransferase